MVTEQILPYALPLPLPHTWISGITMIITFFIPIQYAKLHIRADIVHITVIERWLNAQLLSLTKHTKMFQFN